MTRETCPVRHVMLTQGMLTLIQHSASQSQTEDGAREHWSGHLGANNEVVKEPPWPDRSCHLDYLHHFHDHDSQEASDTDHEATALPSRLKTPEEHDSSCQSPPLSSSECVTCRHHPSDTVLLPGSPHCSLPEPVSLLEEVLSWRRTRQHSEHIRTKVIPHWLSEPRPNVSLFHPLPPQHCLSLTYILLLLLLGTENLSAHI